jgi:methylmalonyl-CoA mutase N-terminal domain/subunit
MYRGRLWTMRQYAGYASSEESNRRYRYLLAQGQTGLSVAFDLPTQVGYDADDPMALGEVGKVGVSISSLRDMQILFDQIPLDQVSTSMTINAPAAILLAMYIAVAKRQGVETRSLRGTIQNDILKEYIARGTYIFPPAQSMRLVTDVFHYCHTELPRWNTISISGYHIREAAQPLSRRWLSPWPMPLPTSRLPCRQGWMWTSLPASFHSSSMPTTTSWRRSPSSAPPAACGRA